ncbi:MAG: hypothetical protein WCT01_02455 [Candidatus Shapirobacteria bacterium]
MLEKLKTIQRRLALAFIADSDYSRMDTRCSLINADGTCPRDCGNCGDFAADAEQILDLTVARGGSQLIITTENGGREWVGFGGGKRISAGAENGIITLKRDDVD